MPAPAPAHASKPIAISQEDYWARAAQYFSSAASQVRCTVPLSWLAPKQHARSSASLLATYRSVALCLLSWLGPRTTQWQP